MLVKYISQNKVKYFQGWIKENGIVYTNSLAEQKALNYGYKELVDDEVPEYDFESQYVTAYYADEDNCVRKRWKVITIEQEEIT